MTTLSGHVSAYQIHRVAKWAMTTVVKNGSNDKRQMCVIAERFLAADNLVGRVLKQLNSLVSKERDAQTMSFPR